MKLVVRELFSIFVSLFFFASCAAQEVVPFFECSNTLREPYGVTSHFGYGNTDYNTQEPQLLLMKELGMTHIRHDYLPAWNSVWDVATERNNRSGVQTLGILTCGEKGNRPWDDTLSYKSYLESLLDNYGYQVRLWEVMNEVDLLRDGENKTFSIKTAEGYLIALPMIFSQIKKKLPDSKVVSTGVCRPQSDFMEYWGRNGWYRYFDVLNLHSYEAPERLVFQYEAVFKNMKKYEWSRPVWLTECGMPTQNDTASMSVDREDEQAKRVARIHIISFAYGVDKIFWYNMRSLEADPHYAEHHFGLLHSDLSPKPAYLAYLAMTKMLPSKSTRPTLSVFGDTYLSSWKRSDGKRIWAIWNSKQTRSVALRISGRYRLYDYFGNEIKEYDLSNFDIKDQVVYIENARSVEILRK